MSPRRKDSLERGRGDGKGGAKEAQWKALAAKENVLSPSTETTEKWLCQFLGHLLC